MVERSWRHTPFRKVRIVGGCKVGGSWRHTPFRNQLTP
ncbi:hypothetical protein URS_2229 [Acinetobacter ursingii]|nr:hypothetical protein URS_2229 [Acinetobacter ursingii]